MCIYYNSVYIFSPVQVKNNPCEGAMKHASNLGPVSTVANIIDLFVVIDDIYFDAMRYPTS